MVDQRGTRRKRNWTTVALAVLVIGAGLVTAFPAASAEDPTDVCKTNHSTTTDPWSDPPTATADAGLYCLGCGVDTLLQVGLGAVTIATTGCNFPDCEVTTGGGSGGLDEVFGVVYLDCGATGCWTLVWAEAQPFESPLYDVDAQGDCKKVTFYVL